MAEYKLISSDSHDYEPPDLWTSRIDPEFRDRAPRIISQEDGDWWYCEGRKVLSMSLGAQTGRRFEEPGKLSRGDKFENVRPGAYDPEERIKDMDLDGVSAEVIYSSVGFNLFRVVEESQLLTAIFRARNDWSAEFCSAYPDRLKGIALVNVDDVHEGIKEMERTRKMGFVGTMITSYPPFERAYNSPEYESLWAAAADLEMPISLHVASNRPGPEQQLQDIDTFTPAFLANVDHWVRMSIAHIIYSSVFERYPKLRVGTVEQELSWIPHFLDRLDFTYTQRTQGPNWRKFKGDLLPSDVFHQNVFCSFQEDALGIRDRYIIGVDNLMWGSDYPHPESTFPRSREILESILEGVPEEEKAKIVGGNVARLYNIG